MTDYGPSVEALKSLILDFQEAEPDTGVRRRLCIETVPGKAAVCIGVRRGGKSTYLYQLIAGLLARGVPRQNILYLNFFDDRLHHLRHGGLGLITDAYYSLYPEKKNVETVHCFFDEIQAAPGWEPFVDRLLRTERCRIHLTGSSAQLLSREIATQMRGRALSWELFPFSFREFLDYRGIDGAGELSTRRRFMIVKAFGEYWERGAFPEVAGLGRDLRIRIHQEYFNTILFRDMIERHDVSHPRAVVDLAHRLVDSAASLYTVNSLTGYLKSLGHKVPKAAVSAYLAWFEDAYFLFTVRIFDASMARRNANPKKVYCIDHALIASVASGILIKFRASVGEPGIHGAAAPARGNPLLPDPHRARGRLRRPAPRRQADAGAGVRVPAPSADAEAGDLRPDYGHGGAGRADRNPGDPRRTGADRGRRRRHRGGADLALPPRRRRLTEPGAAGHHRQPEPLLRRA